MFLFLSWYGKIYLDRKYQLMRDAVVQVDWFSVRTSEFEFISCDRKRIAEEIGKSESTICDCISGRNKNPQGYSIERVRIEEMVTLPGDRAELKPGEPLDEGCVQIRINNCMLTANCKWRPCEVLKRMGVQTIES